MRAVDRTAIPPATAEVADALELLREIAYRAQSPPDRADDHEAAR
jgi:hypothetical protein